ncbi:MAG: PD40 domain-containing protein, partial [Verrucomicrobiae bacterium]|nr:PD40 domain-containing protein [Verrucomicrobiae bacterium]
SPEGGELALTLSKDGNPELYTCSRGGGGFNRLTRTRGAESGPSWSPDGSKIVYSYDGNGLPQIYVTSAGGGGASQLTRGGYNTEPTWAPRSALIAYSQRSGGGFNIMAMNPDGSGITTYTTGEHPSWGPDGRHLVFARSGTVYLLDVLTGHSTPIRGDLGDCSEPSWSGTVR